MARFGSLGEQYLDNAGDPLISGKIYFKESGTDTDKDTFADVTLDIKNTNPVILSGAGRQPNVFFEGSAKAILTDSDDVQVEVRDPVGGDAEEGAFSSWDSLTIYSSSDIVIGSDGLFYLSITNGNQDNDPTTDAVNWSEIRFIRVWNANETYSVNRIVEGSDGKLYTSLIDNNLGNDPTTDTVNWRPFITAVTGAIDGARIADAISGGNESPTIPADSFYSFRDGMCYFSLAFINIDTTGMTAGNVLYLTGLPYTSRNGIGTANIYPVSGVISNYSGTSNQIVPVVAENGTSMTFVTASNNAPSIGILVGEITSAASDIWVSGSYPTE